MGSTLQLSAWTTDEAAAQAAFSEVFAEFDRLESLLSVWRPGSDVIRLNDAAGEAPVPISADTRAVLLAARQASEFTQGKFDITFGALADVWKFDHDQDNRVPSADEIRARLPLVDYQQVVVDEPPGTAFIRRRGMRVHLGGIGKGYAIDRAVALLRQRGFANFMIQAGGDLYVAGLNNGQPWTLGIRDPRGPADRVFATIEMGDGTFSTSGDYERFFLRNGRRYHHLLDPNVGEPARLTRSVTIALQQRAAGRRAVDGRLCSWSGARHGTRRAPAWRRSGDRHGEQRGVGLDRVGGADSDRHGANRRAVTGNCQPTGTGTGNCNWKLKP